MDNSQREVFEQKIELLEMQIQEQSKREEILRHLNNALQQQFKNIATERDQQEQINIQLTDKLNSLKDRHLEEIRYSETENSRLKNQLNGKIKQFERMEVQFDRREIVYEEKIRMLENMIEKKCHRVGDLQKKLHDQSICNLKETSRISNIDRSLRNGGELAVSAIQYSRCQTENNMKYSNLSMQTREFMRMDKSQLKTMMGAMIKSKRQLDQINVGDSCQLPKRNARNSCI